MPVCVHVFYHNRWKEKRIFVQHRGTLFLLIEFSRMNYVCTVSSLVEFAKMKSQLMHFENFRTKVNFMFMFFSLISFKSDWGLSDMLHLILPLITIQYWVYYNII